MALKKSEIYSTLTKCCNKLRSNSGIGAESFKNYVLILLFLKYISDRKKSGENSILILPEGCTFDDIIAMKGLKGKEMHFIPGVTEGYSTIGDGINKVIGRIIDANELEDVIDLTKHDFCSNDLGDPSKASKIIGELVSAFQDEGLDFSKNRAADDDLIGDAYEYLMRNFASQAGKDKGQFFTPTEVSRLMAQLIGIDQDDRLQISAYDPTCGSGSLLLRVRAAAKKDVTVSVFGQDIDPANRELSFLNAMIHGCETSDIRCNDTLNYPQHVENGQLMTFDYVVSNPKFSLHSWMNGAMENDVYGRWNAEIGIPPQQYGDFAFLLHCIKSLKYDGKCAIILPNGVLTRGGDEEKLRKWLVTQKLLSGIIAFPQNAFFGTSIAGNVLVIDNRRVQDGVFFIDASELGYKDADSKIRLREQDIKRITDVWRKRKDEEHFAHLATYDKMLHEGEQAPTYEIEHNAFALNMSLYVTPIDKEIHQNIDAHLHGGMPNSDIDRMQEYWDVCGTLKDAIFKPLREGFSQLAINKDAIAETIESNDSFTAQSKAFAQTLTEWCSAIKPEMLAVDKNNDPKEIIATWGQSILDKFKECQSLVGHYDVYDQLLGYYNDSMQDDLYIISNGGWMPKLVVPTKKTVKWTDFSCDLLPVDIAIKHFLPELKSELDIKENELSLIQEKMTTLKDDNEDEFSEETLDGKLNAATLKKLKKSHIWQSSTPKQRELWEKYAKMLGEEKALKDDIKKQETNLLSEIKRVYAELTPETAKSVVVNDKWLAEITNRVEKEMQTITHNITAEITALVKRYEFTLGSLNSTFEDKEKLVMGHLKEMGFEI